MNRTQEQIIPFGLNYCVCAIEVAKYTVRRGVMVVNGAQIRAGRAFAKLTAAELASFARVGRMTVVRAELTDDVPPITKANLFAIQAALEAVGVFFGADGSVSYRPNSQEA